MPHPKRVLVLAFTLAVVMRVGSAAVIGSPVLCPITLAPERSIQETLNAAPDGAVICLAEGEWSEDLVITRSVTLRGAGSNKTVIRGSSAGSVVVDIDPRGKAGVLVEIVGIGVTGTAASCPGAPERDYLRVLGEASCRTGLLVRGEASVRIVSCRISALRRGVTVWDEARADILDSAIERNALVGLSALGRAVATAANCTVASNWTLGVEASGESRVALRNCVIDQQGYMGISAADKAQITLIECVVRENRVAGVFLDEDCIAALQDCEIRDNGLFGIGVGYSTQASVGGCVVSGHVVGILLSDEPRVTITSSRIVSNQIYGIALDDVETCAFGFGGPRFAGSIMGTGNVVPGPDSPDGNGVSGLCPSHPSDPWPAGFLLDGPSEG